MGKDSIKVIASNKKAYHDYFVDETYEAGIELFGTEVKSVRQGHCSVKEAFIRADKGELYVLGMHINPYEKGNIFKKGYTLIPLQVYLKGSLVKVQVGLCRGKKLYDKREDLAKKTQRRELEREFKSANIRL